MVRRTPATRALQSIIPSLVFLTWLGTGTVPCAALDLELRDVAVPGGEFRFKTISPRQIDGLPFDPDNEALEEKLQKAQTGHYELFALLDEIHWVRYGYFRYKIYVRPKAAPDKAVVFTLTGRPVGAFLAQMADIDFFIGSEANTERGQITLPVFSRESPSYLLIPSWTEPETVKLPGEREIGLWLKNELKDIPVLVKKVHPPMRTGLWQSIGLQGQGADASREFEIESAARLDNVVVVKLVPNSFEALTKILLSNPTQTHEKITVLVDYGTLWGLDQTAAIQVPVRFEPALILLLSALTIGVGLGSLLPVLAGRRKWALRAFLVALFTAILLQLIGIFLVQNNSELRVFGFALDPRELLPAALLGAFMGALGFKSWDFIEKEILRRPRAV